MKVTVVQTDIAYGKHSENQKHAEDLLNKSEASDLYVLPEMWNTGFITSSCSFAEKEEESLSDGSLAWMRNAARKRNAAVCGSMAIRTSSGQCVNRLYFACPDGTLTHYDKRHLFSPGGENLLYTSGDERVIVSYKGIRFLLLVCYDLRFPVWSRFNDDYDAIICVANWPAKRQEVWTTLLRARAMENQCHVIGANRTGDDDACHYEGGSIIVDPYGNIIANGGKDEGLVTAGLDFGRQERFRTTFAAQNDRDHFYMR